MNTTIVNCTDGTFDLVMTNDDKSKGVKKNFVFYDSINEDQETVLMAAFIHLDTNQWISLEDDTLLEYPCYVNDGTWDNLTDGWDSF